MNLVGITLARGWQACGKLVGDDGVLSRTLVKSGSGSEFRLGFWVGCRRLDKVGRWKS